MKGGFYMFVPCINSDDGSTPREKLVCRLKRKVKMIKKGLKYMLLKLAKWELQDIINKQPKRKFVFMTSKKSPPQINRASCKDLEGEGMFIFTACTNFDQSTQVHILVQGPEQHFNALAGQIIDLFKAEGEFKNGTYEGKAMDMSQKKKCNDLIEQYFNTLTQTK